MTPDSIFLLDDDVEFSVGLCAGLTDRGAAVHAFEQPDDLFAWLPRHAVAGRSVVLAKMDRHDTHDVLTRLSSHHARVPVVALIARPSVSTAVELMHRGAAYALHKPFSAAQAADAASRALASTHSAGNAREFDEARGNDDVARRVRSLSTRQRQVLAHVFEGRMNKVIAGRLGLSLKTVEMHRARMMKTMQASSAVELIKMTAPYGDMLRQSSGG